MFNLILMTVLMSLVVLLKVGVKNHLDKKSAEHKELFERRVNSEANTAS